MWVLIELIPGTTSLCCTFQLTLVQGPTFSWMQRGYSRSHQFRSWCTVGETTSSKTIFAICIVLCWSEGLGTLAPVTTLVARRPRPSRSIKNNDMMSQKLSCTMHILFWSLNIHSSYWWQLTIHFRHHQLVCSILEDKQIHRILKLQ